MKPATAAVLDFLRLRGKDGATPAEARNAIACDRLAARVFELRRAGYDIESIAERTPMGSRIARYYLTPDPVFQPVTGTQEGMFPR